MKVEEKIRLFREAKHITQEEIADRIGMSTSGYSKLERGEVRLNLNRLEQIAEILEMNVTDLLREDSGVVYQINEGDNNNGISFYANTNESLKHEVEKLKTIVEYQQMLLEQKDKEIVMQKELIELYKNKTQS